MIEFYKEFGELGYLANYSNHGFTKDEVFIKLLNIIINQKSLMIQR